MHFNIEPAECIDRHELCPNQFVMRGYKDKNLGKYFGVTTVIQRGNGLWEPTAWQTNGHVPEKDYAVKAVHYLISLGYRISGTIEQHRLKAYRRMFQGHFSLKRIKNIDKEYNGKVLHFAYVEFMPIEEEL